MKPIFSRHKDINKMAFINWRFAKGNEIQNLFNLAEGYLLASLELAKRCIKDNQWKTADILIFPILSNANHGIELYLKGLTWTLNELMSLKIKIQGRHNIKQIFETLKSKVVKYNGPLTTSEFNAATKELWTYIIELYEKTGGTQKDDKMDFSRYPFGIAYEDHFYIDDDRNIEIDLENFVMRFETIKKNLNTLKSVLYDTELSDYLDSNR